MTALNPALSDFGQRQANERQRLLSQLVQRLAGAQLGEERHGELLEACLAAVQHQRFADANPRHVAEMYERLGERFGESAQFGKQRALQLLQKQLLGLQLDSSQYDFQYRLLSFLYAASRNPLSASYGGSPLVEALEQAARTAVVGSPTYLTDASSDSWQEELAAYSPGSRLSDWSHLDAEELEEELAGEQAGLAALPGKADAGGDTGGPAAAAAAAAGALLPQERAPGSPGSPPSAAAEARAPAPGAGGRRLAPPPSPARRESPYTRHSLSVWIASKQSGGQPARLLEPRLCFHEKELAQQVVHMLKGVSNPGPAFQLDALGGGAYTPRPGVHLHSSSQGSARALLQRFARAGTALRRVQSFCAAVQQAGGSPGSAWASGSSDDAAEAQRQLLALPTVAAFAAAVAQQQQCLQQQLLVIEAALASGAALTLLQLQQRTASMAQQAAVLERLAARCCRRRASAAETAAGLLSGLHEALQVELLQARSQGGVLASILLRIFTAACRPLLATLHGWLYRGVLHDPWAEFFVRASGADIPTDSPRFWSEAYTLRTSSSGGGAGCGVTAAPCFLLPLAPSILAAGKATLLLQAYSSWRLAAAAAGAAWREGPGGSSTALPAAAAAAAGLAESPSKRRLSEYGALGFAIAAGHQEAQRQQPYGVPPPAALQPRDGFALLGEGAQDEPLQEPPQLHQQLLRNLEAQLQQHMELGSDMQTRQAQSQHQRQLFSQAGKAVSAGAGVEAGADDAGSSQSSDSHTCLQEWQPSAAGLDHSMLLPDADTLPALVVLPASPEGLPAAQEAVIQAAAEPSPASGAANGAEHGRAHGSSSSSRGRGSVPSMGDRMRQAAAARVRQATCAAAEQLPLLLIPPAPLEAISTAAAAAARDARSGGASPADAAAAAAEPEAVAAAATSQFESSSWQQYYQQVSAALAQQLDVLDCLGGGGGGSGSRQRQLASSYGVPLGLPAYSGNPSEQLWGRDGGASARAAAGTGTATSPAAPGLQVWQQPLQPQLAAEAPPLQVLLQHSLLQPVQAQVEAASSSLCSSLLRHGLLRQLAALRDTYLLGSPLLEPFVSFLLRRISTTGGGMDRVSEFELNASLQDALVAGGKAHLRASAQILPAAAAPGAGPGAARGGGAAAAAAAGVVPRVQQLARLRLRVEPGWPLSLVVGEEMLEQYNAVLVLLLQLRWVKQSLQAVRYTGWKAGRRGTQCAAARDGLQHQMVHLVDAVLQYTTDRVVAAGAWLEQAVEGCTSLDQMHACRSKYLRAVTRYCLLSSEGVTRLVHEGLLHLLNACLHYCSLRRQDAAAAAALAALAEAGGEAAVLLAEGLHPGQQQRSSADGDDEDGGGGGEVAAAAAAAAGLPWAGRRAELQRRRVDAAEQLARLRREFANRQRLLLRVLSTKAAEAGSHADELRQLLGALDYNWHFMHSMT